MSRTHTDERLLLELLMHVMHTDEKLLLELLMRVTHTDERLLCACHAYR